MTIYHCDTCEVEWGWDSNLPPPQTLGTQGMGCPLCLKKGVAGPFLTPLS